MTLFIAWILIDGLHLDPSLKWWAVFWYVLHLVYHAGQSK